MKPTHNTMGLSTDHTTFTTDSGPGAGASPPSCAGLDDVQRIAHHAQLTSPSISFAVTSPACSAPLNRSDG